MNLVPFLGVDIETGPGALIPRAETALLGRTALEKLRAAHETPRFVDVCCGTGNLACALAAAHAGARGFALDLTEGCVALARRNVDRLGLAHRVTVLQGDLFAPLHAHAAPHETREGHDLIVCNPPYISTGKLEGRDDLRGEPREAFDGGPYGIAIHQRVAREAPALLRPGGWLAFEIGHGQARQVELLLGRTKSYDTIELVADDTGATRVVAARKKPQ